MKILISFEFEKKLDLYLMKIQISFVFRKIKSVFNENTDNFVFRKIKFVFNENTDQL